MATEPVLRFMAITRKITFITGRGRRAIGGQGCEDIKTSCIWFKESWASVWLTQIVHFCIVKVDFGIRLWFMESPAVPGKHIYDSGRIKNFSSFVSPFPPHSRFLSNLWACYGSLIWASAKSAWPQRCDCGGGHYGSALGFRDDPGHGWHHKVSFPPPSSTPESSKLRHRNEVAELAERHPPLPSFSSRLNYFVFQKGIFLGGGTLQKKKKKKKKKLFPAAIKRCGGKMSLREIIIRRLS